jgi:hypothetical protein
MARAVRRFAIPVLKPMLPAFYKIFPALKNIKRYTDTFGRMPNIIRPRTFNERIQRRILFDRNPRLKTFADKPLVRKYLRSRLAGGNYLTELYAVVYSPAEIGRLRLPSRFVMKPNHASGMTKIVMDSSKALPGELEELAAGWLSVNYYDVTQEWAYKGIKPRILFEELLEVDGDLAYDYKFFCFDGEPHFFYVVKGRLRGPKINFYDLNLSLLPVRIEEYENFSDEVRFPPNFDVMLEVSRRLSAETDFLRVDMYNLNGRIVIGELTNYPANGRTKFVPREWDLKFGTYWR